MVNNDILVKAIFGAVDQQGYSSEQKRIALVRAGLIARAYVFEAELLFPLKQDGDMNASLASVDDGATAH